MTSILDQFKADLKQAEKAAGVPSSIYDEVARKIVNIERQSFYGDKSDIQRLKKIRELISEEVKKV